MIAAGEAMPEPKPKPRRSIFDTLKKSANGRLGLSEAAHLADKISVFPVRQAAAETPAQLNDPTLDPTQDLSLDPTAVPTQPSELLSGLFSDQQSEQELGLSSAQPTVPLSEQASGRRSGPLPRQPSVQGLAQEPTPEPTWAWRDAPTVTIEPAQEPTVEPTPVPQGEPTKAGDDPDMKRIIRSLPENKRRFLHFIIDGEPVGDDYIISRQTVARALHLTEISVKRYFAEFADLGFFHKETYRRGVCQGLRLILSRPRCQAFKRHDPTLDLRHDPTAALANDPTGRGSGTDALPHDPTNDPTVAPTFFKEDRKKESLCLSSERITLTWPNLARAGFGREQLEQIAAALAELGKSADKVLSGLDHAEWELASGAMRDKDGQSVLDPCAWVFRSLARTGYYRRPKGYVSPEEQAERDAEEEARAVAVARQKAEQARFEAWRDGLSSEELARVMRGHPGGPRDAWLKAAWRKAQG